MHNPLAQFEIRPLVSLNLMGHDISFTNSALLMTIAVVFASCFMLFATRRKELVPTRTQMIAESLFGMIENMLKQNVGEGEGNLFLLFSLYLCLCYFVIF